MTDFRSHARRGSARLVVVMTIGVVIAALLVFVVLNLDPRDTPKESISSNTPPEELITPRPVDADSPRIGIGEIESGPSIDVPTGGFIEVAGEDGQAEQRYKFDRLDPTPEGFGPNWMNATNPTVQLINGDQLIVMTAASALLYAPNRVIESGTLSGEVLVKVFEGFEPATDASALSPTMTVRTSEASYDHVLGEIRCDRDVDIDAVQGRMPGRGLRVLVDDENRQRYSMHLEELDYLLIRDTPSSDVSEPEAIAAVTGDGERTDQPRSQRRADQDQSASEPSIAAPVQWYQITFQSDVRIQHGELGASQRATGDALTIRFSSESESVGSAFAFGSRPRSRARPAQFAVGPMTREQAMAAMIIGTTQDEPFLPGSVPMPGPNETVITCAGPLTINPLDDASQIPDDPDDVVVQLQGAPATLHDEIELSDATCGVLQYHATSQSIAMLRRGDVPVELNTPDFAIGADHLWLNNEEQRAGVIGAGWMHPQDDAHDNQDDSPPAANDSDPLVQMRITWQEGVELKFREATEPDGETQLERAEFKGDVVVDGDQGYVGANVLDLHFRMNDAGKSVPERMIATTDVKVKDADITLWSDDLVVTLRESAAGTDPDADANPPADAGDPMMSFGDDIEIDTIVAKVNVQILLADGSRAFADHFEADAANENAVLTGDNVTVISNRMIVDRGTRMELVRSGEQGTITVPGPGQAVILSKDIDVSADERIERPMYDEEENPSQVNVHWSKRMHYDGAFANAAGAIEFEGGVAAMVEPNPTEEQSMTGEYLRMEFANRDVPAGEGPPADDAAIDFTSKRALHRLIARGDDQQAASLESRIWPDEFRDDTAPQLFSISGPEIDFNNTKQEAVVTGAGDLLIQDLTVEPDRADADETALAGKGISHFTWTESLRLEPLVENDMRLTINGNVVLKHMSQENEPSTLTTNTLEAEISRPDAADRPADAEFDFGGSAELRRVVGSRNVVIRTVRYTIDTDRFDYNVGLSQAQITADPGKRASIHDRSGNEPPIFVRSAVWNMKTNAMQLTGIGGG